LSGKRPRYVQTPKYLTQPSSARTSTAVVESYARVLAEVSGSQCPNPRYAFRHRFRGTAGAAWLACNHKLTSGRRGAYAADEVFLLIETSKSTKRISMPVPQWVLTVVVCDNIRVGIVSRSRERW
jgi:hypothetical protein